MTFELAPRPITPQKKYRIKGASIKVRTPLRGHLSVLDMNKFSPGKAGGGGIGLPLPLHTKIDISLSDDFEYNGPDKYRDSLKFILDAFRLSTGFKKHFYIKVEVPGFPHNGLGTHSSLFTGALFGVNLLLGRPLDYSQIRHLIALNYVERKESLVPAFETGVGPAAILYKAFVIISDELEIVISKPIPDDFFIAIVIPKLERDFDETHLLMKYGRLLDKVDGARKAHEVLINLYPKLAKGDWRGVGESIWRLQHIGSKLIEILQYKEWPIIYESMKTLRRMGALVTGMSSLGPTIVAMFAQKPDISSEDFPVDVNIHIGSSREMGLKYDLYS